MLRREAQEARALRIALAVLVERHIVHPCDFLGEALVAERLRHHRGELFHDRAPEPGWEQAVEVHHALAREAVVAGKVLVAPVAAQHHLHLFRRDLRDQVDAHAEGVGRFVHVVDHGGDQVDHVRLHDALAGAQPVLVRHHARVGQLVEALLLHADRKSGEGFAGDLRHQRGDEAGINAPAQEGSDRHIAEQMQLNGLAQQMLQLVGNIPLAPGYLVFEIERPVLFRFHRPPVEKERGGRRELFDVLEQRAVVRNEPERHVVPDRRQIQFRFNKPGGEDRLDFGSEEKNISVEIIEQRLLAHVITGEKQRFVARIPDRNAEHAPQVFRAVCAVFFVKMKSRFHVGVRLENVPARFEVAAQLGAVVDFAIAHQLQVALFVADRLVPAGHVHDAQPPLADRNGIIVIKTLVVRPAMLHRVRQLRDDIPVTRSHNACNAAHKTVRC